MSTFFYCKVDEQICQSANQVAITEISVDQLAQIGVSAASIAQATTLGFGMVFFAAVIGLVVGWIVRMIRLI